MTKYLPILLLFVLATSACENMKTDFDPGVKETSPRLVVHAGLDNVDSIFTLHITKTSPLAGVQVENLQPFDGKQVRVELYEGDRLLLEVDNPEPEGENIFMQQKVQSVAAGLTYRLRVAVEGFDAVESTVVAPAALTLAECSIDTSRWIAKNRTWTADYGSGFGGYSGLFDAYRYHPAKIGIVDLTTDKCYYAIELFYNVTDNLGRQMEGGLMYVATNNQLLVQDNPYIEDDGILSDGDAPEAFAFRQMVISNLLFANKICKEEFLLSAIYDTKKEDLMNVDSTGDFPSIGYTEDQIEEVEVAAILKVRRLTTEQFQYYRTGILQGWSGGDIALFMEEPVSVPSNIANGYGNFSVSTAVQQELYRRRVWRVKQQQYY